ncbi:hypothetical protein [Ramlibacter ginsenosidimutans]|uniref:hypothetical protein n=1 Tax=Ramlibacter ginsenosidimutans TaxID=502333 RepID=UPI001A92C80C|nr:hypothetical protein [Ramlibacter ginsenosidimutans]
MFELTLDKASVVQAVKVHTFDSKARVEIAESISRRFGPPFESQLSSADLAWASWRSAEGSVGMHCSDECWIDFRTPSEQAEVDAEQADRARRDAARPKAP